MPIAEPVADLAEVAQRTPYPLDAFLFVQRGLDFTVRRVHGEMDEQTEAALAAGKDVPSRHIDGKTLCDGLRDFAQQQYGLMARTVFRRWHITRSEDFGHIVFAMVDAGLMQKTDNDRIEDFQGIFDLANAFAHDLSLRDG